MASKKKNVIMHRSLCDTDRDVSVLRARSGDEYSKSDRSVITGAQRGAAAQYSQIQDPDVDVNIEEYQDELSEMTHKEAEFSVISDVPCSESECQIEPTDDIDETTVAELGLCKDMDMPRWRQVDSDIAFQRQRKTRSSAVVDNPACRILTEQQLSEKKEKLEREIERCRTELQTITHGVSENSSKNKVRKSATSTNSDTAKCEEKRSGDRHNPLTIDRRSLSKHVEDNRHPKVESKDLPRLGHHRIGNRVYSETDKFHRSHTPLDDTNNSSKAYLHSRSGERRFSKIDRRRIDDDSPNEWRFSSKYEKAKAPLAVTKVDVSDKKLTDRGERSDKCSDSTDDNSDDPSHYRRSFRCTKRGSIRHHRHNHRETSADSSESTSIDRSYHKSKRDIKPDKFNGTTSLETFLMQFSNCSDYNKWSEKDRVAHLRWSLTGCAAQLLWGTEGLSYKQLVKKLRARFGAEGMEERFETELRCRRRKPNESLRELAQDIRKLMTLAYPEEKSRMAEHMARDYFLVALDDPELELKVREREPLTMDAAVKIAQRYEVFKDAVSRPSNTRYRNSRQVIESSRQSPSDSLEERVAKIEQSVCAKTSTDTMSNERKSNNSKQDKRKEKQRARATTVVKEDSWKDNLLKKMNDLEAAQIASVAQSKKIAAENDALQKEVGRLRCLEQLRSVPASSVTERQMTTPQRTSSNRYERPRNCFNCGEPGHYAKNCCQPPRRNTNTTESHGNETVTFSVSGTSESVNHSSYTHDSYLHGILGNKPCDCLLDTGSEVCLLPESLVDPLSIRRTTRSLKAANGTPITTLGETTLALTIGNFVTDVTGLVSDHVSEVMLGIDWLVANNAIWNFRRSSIWLGGQSFSLVNKTDRKTWCRRVTLQENVVVPPRAEADIPTKVVFHRLPTAADDGLWGTDLNYINPGLHVARTVIPENRWSDLPIRVMNVSEEPIFLRSGSTVADLHQVEIVGKDHLFSLPNHDSDISKPKRIANKQDEVPDFIEKLVDGVDDSLHESACLALREILKDRVDVFSQSEYDLGRTDIITHQIDTGDARPVRQALRRYPPAHIEAISKHIDSMLSQGIVESAASPWASNIVLVRKKDGSLRCCIDYRQLNSVTRKDAYPLPRIDTCLDAMSSAVWFSTFDLRQSYHQVIVDPKDRDKTAFICHRGMFRYRTMPFGLCNAGATFQRLMDIVMSGLHLDVCLVYLDDIILFSRTVEEHLERLVIVLNRLRSAGLKLKPEKCSLFRRSVSFLGHVVSEAGIATDPVKTKAVAEWPVPTSLKEVRSFIGLASYYRRFVKGFAALAAPLHALSKKGQSFAWTADAQSSFDALKEALTSPPILAMPNDSGEFILDTDASDTTIGSVLSQIQDGVERVIAYASRSLDKRECNYCVTRKELLSVVHSVKYFKQYLMGRHFKIRTDHAALTWLRHTPEPIGQQSRWLEVLEEYDYSIEHRPGARHGNADGLSRRPCPVKTCACRQEPDVAVKDVSKFQSRVELFSAGPADRHVSADNAAEVINECAADSFVCHSISNDVEAIPPWSVDGLRVAQNNDSDISCIINLMQQSSAKPPWDTVSLKSSDVKVLWHMWPRLQMRDGLLKRRFETPDGLSVKWQIVLPASLRQDFLTTVHTGMSGAHLARRKTAASIQARAYWPTWSSDLDIFLRSCVPCARYHRGAIPRNASLQPSLVGEVWERVSIDITGPHPKSSRSNCYILTLVDHFSKWAEAIPLRNHTAPVVARALMVHVFSRFGAPRQLLSDRGSEFESEMFSELMNWMEIDKLRTTVFKPSTNAVVERFHRTLNSMLAKSISESQRDWDERLPLVLAAYRATSHSSTGFTPNRLFLGREVRLPVDLLMGLPVEDGPASQTADEYVANLQRQSLAAFELARNHLRANAERRKANYDIRSKGVKFLAGDWVWYLYPRRYQGKSIKWQKCYTGPYLIVRVIEPVNCVLQRSAKSKPFVVHFDKLKKCYGPTPSSWLSVETSSPERADDPVYVDSNATAADEEIEVPQSREGSTTVSDCDCGPNISHTHNTRRRTQPPLYLSDFIVV